MKKRILERHGQELGGGVLGWEWGGYENWEDNEKWLLSNHPKISLGYWPWELWVGTDISNSKETEAALNGLTQSLRGSLESGMLLEFLVWETAGNGAI